MKIKIIILIALSLILISSVAFGATINIRFAWDANTEPDMAFYRFYRTDATRIMLATIPHPTTTYNASIVVPDRSSGTLTFVVTAVDTSGNESGDSNMVSYTFDLSGPGNPKNLRIIIQ